MLFYSQSGSPLTVTNSTFVGNTVTGGDGGAISSSHTILTRSLLAGISSPSCSGVTPTDSGGDRVDDTSCPVTASARLAAALKLGPQADNGGPTRTVALPPAAPPPTSSPPAAPARPARLSPARRR